MKSKVARKPKPPVISSQVLEELYKQAMLYYDLQPWSILSENELFAVQDSISKQINYCCVIGEADGFMGITVYRGRTGLEMHLRIKEEQKELSELEIFDNYDALVAEFSPKKELEKIDLSYLKNLDSSLFAKESYPSFRSYLPGFQGWFLSEKEALSMILAFKCAITHITNCKKDPVFKEGKQANMMLLYTLKMAEEGKPEWEIKEHNPGALPLKKKPAPVFDFLKLEKLKGMKLCHDTAWEAAIFMTPSVIFDKTRPYYAKICMIAHQESFLVLQMKVLELNSCFYTALSELIFVSIEKNKRLPSELLVNDVDLYEALKPLAKVLGIQVSLVEDLPAISIAQDHLLEYMK